MRQTNILTICLLFSIIIAQSAFAQPSSTVNDDKMTVYAYDGAHNSFSEGFLGVRDKGKWGFVDKTGAEVIEPAYDLALPFYEGYAAVKVGGLWGFIDTTGALVIEPAWGRVSSFNDGIAAIYEPFNIEDSIYRIITSPPKNLIGFINTSGEVVVEPVFYDYYGYQERQTKFSEGLAALFNERGVLMVIDKTGAEVFTYNSPHDILSNHRSLIFLRSFINGTAVLNWNNFYGRDVIVDSTGTLLVETGVWRKISRLNNKHACVSTPVKPRSSDEVKEGVIDMAGNIVIEPVWDDIYSVSDDLYAMKLDGKHGLMDKSGNIIAEVEWDAILEYNDWVAPVRKDKKWGVIDMEGNVIIPCEWDKKIQFSDGVAPVEIDRNYGYINKFGEVVIEPVWDRWAGNFSEGLAAVAVEVYDDNKEWIYNSWSYINKSGEVVIDSCFKNSAGDFQDGLVHGVVMDASTNSVFINGNKMPSTIQIHGYLDKEGNGVVYYIDRND